MPFRVVLSLVTLVLLGGCSAGETKTVTVERTVTETATASVPNEAPAVLTVYFLQDGKVAPISRAIVAGPQVARAALDALFEGLTTGESGFENAIPSGTEVRSLSIESGVASVELSHLLPDEAARAQLVYTLTRFATIKRVDLGAERPVGRTAFEAQTPAILVESPLPGEEVGPGFEVTGTANTFEATFQYELRDVSDKILKKDFVTATSGSGTRGTFGFTVPYTIDKSQEGSLTVFEISAADGSRTNERSIPLRLR